ncbi:MAG: proton-conducting transporter membrane subunit [Chloroflexota bacterium]
MPVTQVLILLAYLPPLVLASVGGYILRSQSMRLESAYRAVFSVTFGTVILSLLFGLAVFFFGPMQGFMLGAAEIGIANRLDGVSVAMLWLVSLIGMLIVRYSRNYLDGDPRHVPFIGYLSLTISAVFLLVLSGTLIQLAIGWILTTFALHQLLTFYAERPRARAAGHKKGVLARLSDVALIFAIIFFYQAFGTTDFAQLTLESERALENGFFSMGLVTAGILVVIAAILKSAVYPFHGWLLEVMDAPTPVSALLHAGIINAGTFLIVRFGSLLYFSEIALYLLILIGGLTAIFASIAMMTQSNVKVSLAYSSAAHMGFMLMLCGFGAFSVAILHLIGHSFYKAHAFLSSGSVLEYIQGLGGKELKGTVGPLTLLLSLAGSLAIFVAMGAALGIDITKRPGETALGAIFVMGITYLIIKGSTAITASRRWVLIRTLFSALAVTFAFYALEFSAAWMLSSSVAAGPEGSSVYDVIMWGMVGLFAAIILIQTWLPALTRTAFGHTAYVYLKNGLFANAWLDRLVGQPR